MRCTASKSYLFSLYLVFSLNPILAQDQIIFTLQGDHQSRLDYQFIGIGDQNGDGYDDILVGREDHHAAVIYLGGEVMDTIPDFVIPVETEDTFSFMWISRLGDINDDGVIDFSVVVRDTTVSPGKGISAVYMGGWPPQEFFRYFGAPLKEGGDLNHDGFGDILSSWSVNIPNLQPYIYLFLGGEEPIMQVEDSILYTNTSTFIRPFKGVGMDISGNSIDDLIVIRSATGIDGIAFDLFLGSESFSFTTASSKSYPHNSGTVSFPGDMDGDGISEWVMSTTVIRPSLYAGGVDSLGGPHRIIPELTDEIRAYPYSVGDVNHDGYADLLLSDPFGSGGGGQLAVYLGGFHADLRPDWHRTGWQFGLHLMGNSVEWCGDVNGDGCDDIMFGSDVLDTGIHPDKAMVIVAGDSSWYTNHTPYFESHLPEELSLSIPLNYELQFNIQINELDPDANSAYWYVNDLLVRDTSNNNLSEDSYTFHSNSSYCQHDDLVLLRNPPSPKVVMF